MFNILRNHSFPKLYMFLRWCHSASTFFTHHYVWESLPILYLAMVPLPVPSCWTFRLSQLPYITLPWRKEVSKVSIYGPTCRARDSHRRLIVFVLSWQPPKSPRVMFLCCEQRIRVSKLEGMHQNLPPKWLKLSDQRVVSVLSVPVTGCLPWGQVTLPTRGPVACSASLEEAGGVPVPSPTKIRPGHVTGVTLVCEQ